MSDTGAAGRVSARPARALRSVAALAALELRLTARRGENVLVTLVIPAAVLLFFGAVAVPPGIPGRSADHLVPGSDRSRHRGGGPRQPRDRDGV